MAQVKDYIKVILTALLTAFVTLAVTGAFEKNSKINNAASKTELTESINTVSKESKLYTDGKIKDHEKDHKKISEEITEIKQSGVRLEGKVDEILFLMINK